MGKRLNTFKFVMAGILVLLLLVSCSVGNTGNKISMAKPQKEKALPFTEKVEIGTLDNGMKYYIRNNKFPTNRIEIRLNVRTGSLNETEEERGLAHFVEHMAFNGTTHFEHNDIIKFFEDSGLTFGKHSNAYTSTNVTNYQLSIPADRKDLIEKSFLILSDWSEGLLFNEDEIEKEKGVIIEERRMRVSSRSRVRNQVREILLEGSLYPRRTPIGDMDIVQGANRKLLKGYYDKWYRPDNMAVIVVGDIDPKSIKSLLNKYLSPVTKKKKHKKADIGMPFYDRFRVKTITDPETTSGYVSYDFLMKQPAINSVERYEKNEKQEIAMSIFSKRMRELVFKRKVSFLRVRSVVSGFHEEYGSGRFIMSPDENQIENSVKDLFIEIERAKRYGFTDTEIREELKKRKARYVKAAKPRRIDSSKYADQIVSYDLYAGSMMENTQELELFNGLISKFTKENINNSFKEIVSSQNKVMIFSLPEADKSKALDYEKVESLIKLATNANISPLEERKSVSVLMDKKPSGGTIISQKSLPFIDAKEVTLSNGVQIIFKKTKFDPGKFQMSAIKHGGFSVIEDNEDYIIARTSSAAVVRSGFKGINSLDMPSIMAGHHIRLVPSTTSYSSGFSGSGSVDDAELLFQKIHLYMTAPNVEDDVIKLLKKQSKVAIKSKNKNKKYVFTQKVYRERFNEKFRNFPIEEEDLKLFTKDNLLGSFKEIYSDIGNFRFIFIGDFNIEEFSKYAELYLGGIPSNSEKSSIRDRGVRQVNNGKVMIEKGDVENKTSISINYEKKCDYSIENATAMSLLRRSIYRRLKTEIREKRGGVYGIKVSFRLKELPAPLFSGLIEFTCDPARVDELIKIVKEIIADVAKNGIEEKELFISKKQSLMILETNLKNNKYWLNNIASYILLNRPMEELVNKKNRIQEVSLKQVNILASEYLQNNSIFTSIFGPEEKVK